MTKQVLPEDPELIDAGAEQPEYIRRRRTFSDRANSVSTVLTIAVTVAGIAAWALNYIPYLRTDVYAKDEAAEDLRFQKIETPMARMERNGLLSLQLQLQSKIETLTAALKVTAPNSPNYYAVSSSIADYQQQADEVRRQLRR